MSHEISLKIYTNDRQVTSELFPSASRYTAGETTHVIDDETQVVYQGSFVRKSVGFPDIIELSIRIAEPVSLAIVANWLYEKLKDKKASLEVHGREVDVEKEEIQSTLEEYVN